MGTTLNRGSKALFLLLLLSGGLLRLVGIDRGTTDFVLPEARDLGVTEAFYSFHPDESEVARGAVGPFDPLDPPYTSYGLLPALLLRGQYALGQQFLHWPAAEMSSAAGRHRLLISGRWLAVAASIGVLILTWYLGRALAGVAGAFGAAAVVAFSPGTIQQAHFFIVDGFFALGSAAALLSILCLTAPPRRREMLLAGILIGATMAVRLNAGLLALVLLTGLILGAHGRVWCRPAELPRAVWQLLRQPCLWVAGGAATVTLLLVQPYLVLRPELMTKADGRGDFALALKFASGDLLQPWTLVDRDVIPYLSHWVGGWPLAVGWPLTLLFGLALVWGIWRGGVGGRLLALWCILYLLPVGALPIRAVRHLIPLTAPLAALTAGLVADLLRRTSSSGRRAGLWAMTGVVLLHLVIYGLAFSRIYVQEDSRIQAARFIAAQIPAGTGVGVEGGAFSMAELVSPSRHPHVWLNMSRLFYTGPYMLCADRVEFLRQAVRRMGAMTIVDANRRVQYAAAPEMFPVAAGFYERLLRGALGFEVMEKFKSTPHLDGIIFAEEGVDPSFVGYDHPTVYVMRRSSTEAVEGAFGRWQEAVVDDRACPDRPLREIVAQMRDGNLEEALRRAVEVEAAYPYHLLARRLQVDLLRRLGRVTEANRQLARFLPVTAGDPVAHVYNPGTVHYVAPVAAVALTRLGLPDLALEVLREQGGKYTLSTPNAQVLADQYLRVAHALELAGRTDLGRLVVAKSLTIYPTAVAYNAMALYLRLQGRTEEAVALLERSLTLDSTQAQTHLELARLLQNSDPEEAQSFAGRAAQLDPALGAEAAAVMRQLPGAP